MIRISIITGLLLLSSFVLLAQRPPGGGGRGGMDFSKMPSIGQLSGLILDSLTNEPLEYATIAVQHARVDSFFSGAVTDKKGRFFIDELKPGPYEVKVSYIGYQPKLLPKVMLGRNNEFKSDLGRVYVSAGSSNLNEIQVTAERQYMETKLDRKVFNVEKDLSSKGGSLTDVLENIPSVEIDIDGNLSFRGSSNLTVLIDGRPSGLTGSSRNAMLQQIPANTIQSVEVITNPSAKFAPDGMNGIINIVLKKDRKKGLNGNITGGYTTWNQYNAGLSLNYRTRKYNLFSTYGYRDGWRWRTGETYRENYFASDFSTLNQVRNSQQRRPSHMIRLGSDFYLNPKNTLTLSGNFSSRNSFEEDLISYQEYYSALDSSAYRIRTNGEDEVDFSYDLNAVHVMDLKKEGQELTFDFGFSKGAEEEIGIFNELPYQLQTQDYIWLAPEKNVTQTDNSQVNARIDYVHPLNEDSKIEAGWETRVRSITTDFDDLSYSGNEFELNPLTSNEFEYREQFHAVYGSYGRQIDKFGFSVGVRLEQAFTDSKLIETDELFENNYFSVYPTAHLSYKLPKKQEISLSYSRRVNRPRGRQLNPFSDRSDPLNFRQGNPFLNPEYVNSLEYGYSKFFNLGMFTTSIYYKNINDMITRLRTVDAEGIATSSYTNLTSGNSVGWEAMLNLKPFKWWTVNTSFNFTYTRINSENIQTELNENSTRMMGRMSSNFKAWKGGEIQLSGFYFGPRISGQGNSKAIETINLAIKQEFLKDKLNITLRFNDIFDQRQWSFTSEAENFFQDATFKRQSRVANLSLTWLFGTQDKSRRKRGGSRDSGGGFEDMEM